MSKKRKNKFPKYRLTLEVNGKRVLYNTDKMNEEFLNTVFSHPVKVIKRILNTNC